VTGQKGGKERLRQVNRRMKGNGFGEGMTARWGRNEEKGGDKEMREGRYGGGKGKNNLQPPHSDRIMPLIHK
jgi:hypothetical protein